MSGARFTRRERRHSSWACLVAASREGGDSFEPARLHCYLPGRRGRPVFILLFYLFFCRLEASKESHSHATWPLGTMGNTPDRSCFASTDGAFVDSYVEPFVNSNGIGVSSRLRIRQRLNRPGDSVRFWIVGWRCSSVTWRGRETRFKAVWWFSW